MKPSAARTVAGTAALLLAACQKRKQDRIFRFWRNLMAKRELGLEKIASEVGRLFGTTEAYAQRWLDQREELLNALAIVRDKASGLISELGGEHLPWRASGKATPGIPVVQPGMRESRKKRVLSAATRAKMRAAAKKRWAAIRKTTSRSNRQK